MQRGFSLVELSIVLVILGLLTGGILAGKSLIRASELRSVVTEVDRYQTALMAFRDRYFQLPGDMSNATSFWGDRATGTEACADPATPDGTPGTCNGDGNRFITDGAILERVLSWQHMSLAGLIEGNYSGIGASLTSSNSPFSRLPRGRYRLSYEHIYGQPVTGLWLGAPSGQNYSALLRPEEAWNIDSKLDDGRAFFGKVRSYNGYSSSFPTTGCVATGDWQSTTEVTYTLDQNAITCAMVFIMPV